MENVGLRPPADLEAAEAERAEEDYGEWLKSLPLDERVEHELEDQLRSIRSSIREEIRKAAVAVE